MTTKLTTIEGKLLARLEDRQFHTRKELLEEVVGKRHASASLIGTHIGRLKKKLPAELTIRNTPTQGYRLEEKANGNQSHQ